MNRSIAVLSHLKRAPLLATLALGLLLPAAPALAGDVVARAGKNPNFVEDRNSGASAQASWPVGASQPVASANTTRTATSVAITGAGTNASFHHNAASSHITDYQLWDLDSNSAVESTLARTAELDFHFALSGFTFVDSISLSTMNFQHFARLDSSFEDLAESSLVAVFGPSGYLFTGDMSLFGAFNQTFSLRHSDADGGRLNMLTAGLAANAAGSAGQLSLSSVALAGPWAGGSLGIRLVETGEIIPVTAIPEPGTWALWLAGLGTMGWLVRRRRSRQASAA